MGEGWGAGHKGIGGPTALAPGTNGPVPLPWSPPPRAALLQGMLLPWQYWGSCSHVAHSSGVLLHRALLPHVSHCPGDLALTGVLLPRDPTPSGPVCPGSNSHRGPAAMGDPVHPCPCVCAVLVYVRAVCPAVHPCALTLHVRVRISLLSSRTSVHPCGTCLSLCAASGCCVSGASLRANTSPAPVMPELWAHSHLYSHLWPPDSTSITPTINSQVSRVLPGAARLVTGTAGPCCSQQTQGNGESLQRWPPIRYVHYTELPRATQHIKKYLLLCTVFIKSIPASTTS